MSLRVHLWESPNIVNYIITTKKMRVKAYMSSQFQVLQSEVMWIGVALKAVFVLIFQYFHVQWCWYV